MSAFNEETVLSVHHWTDRLFTFTTTRDQSLRFSNGHFTMIGLRINGKPLVWLDNAATTHKPRQVIERVPRGDERCGDRRAFFEGQAFGQVGEQCGRWV